MPATMAPITKDAMCVVAENCGMNTMISITARKTSTFGCFHHALRRYGVRKPIMA